MRYQVQSLHDKDSIRGDGKLVITDLTKVLFLLSQKWWQLGIVTHLSTQ